ncbi:O-antigen ligase family protein [Halomonas sp. 25-S5]|uniref:O-antigen ligase family protein n=1 Tax=Halomonas sp. 25-S5 TaxID=2994065 RepID=UPI0024698BA8|nr:O-antigen ligase family protein [Halomonas sp. 25-S5]
MLVREQLRACAFWYDMPLQKGLSRVGMAHLKNIGGLPETAWQTPAGLRWFALIGLLAYAALRFLWPEVGEGGGTLMGLLGLVAALTWGKGVRGSGPLWLLLAAVVVQLVSWTGGYFHHSEWISDNPQLDRLAKLFLFIGVAWWLGGNTRFTWLAWGLGALGVILVMLPPFTAWSVWQRGLWGSRVNLSIQNAQHDSMLLGTVLLGLVATSGRLLGAGPWRLVRLISWLLGIAVCLAGVMVTQTRATWLGLLLALSLAGLCWAVYERVTGHPRAARRMFALLGGMILLLVLVGGFFHETIERRLGNERQVIEQIIAGDVEQVPNTSIGVRIHSWRAAGEWIAERPLVGWGGQARGLVMDHTEWLPPIYKERYGHLHNSFLEIWVAYGLLGVGLFVALAAWMGIGTWKAWRAGVMPGDMALFGTAFFVFWMVVNQFESFMGFGSGVYVFNMVMGGLVTHIWRWQLESGQAVFPNPFRRQS